MDIDTILYERSESKCELCVIAEGLGVYEVPPRSTRSADDCILVCETCHEQIEDPKKMEGS
jgi:protein PhnA